MTLWPKAGYVDPTVFAQHARSGTSTKLKRATAEESRLCKGSAFADAQTVRGLRLMWPKGGYVDPSPAPPRVGSGVGGSGGGRGGPQTGRPEK